MPRALSIPESPVIRHMGRASLAGGLLSWAALTLALVLGGLDPPRTRLALLQGVNLGALAVSALAALLAIFALVRGPQRIAASLGLAFSLMFLLYFTGFAFALAGRAYAAP